VNLSSLKGRVNSVAKPCDCLLAPHDITAIFYAYGKRYKELTSLRLTDKWLFRWATYRRHSKISAV